MTEQKPFLATVKSARTSVDGGLAVTIDIASHDIDRAFSALMRPGTNLAVVALTPEAAQDATRQAMIAADEGVSEDRLNEPEQKGDPKEDKEPGGRHTFTQLKRTAQCAIRCGEVAFRLWLRAEYGGTVTTAADAAEAVRRICGVTSRAEFNTNAEAAAAWDHMEARFYAATHGARDA